MNRVNCDCRHVNLRACTRGQNLRNQKIRADNTSGAKGVRRHRKTGKFQGQVTVDGEVHYLGLFGTVVEAEARARSAREKLHQEFARHE